MKKKLFASIVCFLLVLATLASCNGGNKNPQETNPSSEAPETKPEVLQELVPDKNMDRDFIILTYVWEPLDREETGDAIKDIEVRRLKYLENRFNITLSRSAPNKGDVFATLTGLENSDEHEFDLVDPHPTINMAGMLTTGVLKNLFDVNALNLDRPWYNQSQVKNHQINGKLLLAVPDTTLNGQAFAAIVYNTALYQALGFSENLYQTVNEGKWTMEKLISIVRECETSNLGDPENKIYGFGYWKNVSYCFMYALGQNVLQKNQDGAFELALVSDRLTTIVDKINELVFETNATVVSETNNAGFKTSDMWVAFLDGRCLFQMYDIGSMSHLLRELSFEIKYLPLPKLYEADEYRVTSASGFMAIPTIARDYEESGIIMESMAIYSHEYLRPAMYEKIMLGRLSKDPEDYQMLTTLFDSKFYEFGTTFDSKGVAKDIIVNVVFGEGSTISGSNAIASYVKGHRNEFNEIVNTVNALGG